MWIEGSIHNVVQVESETSDATISEERNEEKGKCCVQHSREQMQAICNESVPASSLEEWI